MFADKNKASYREERYAFITTIVSLLDFTEPNPGLGIGNTEKSLTTKVLGVPSILPTSLNYVNIKNKNKKEKKKSCCCCCAAGDATFHIRILHILEVSGQRLKYWISGTDT